MIFISINPRKPTLGLYVRTGAGLPDLADPEQWVFDGTMADFALPTELVQNIEANGHASGSWGDSQNRAGLQT
jgi:hypothetical protein